MDRNPEAVRRPNSVLAGILSSIALAVLAFCSAGVFALDVFSAGLTVAAVFVVFSVFCAALGAALLASVHLSDRRIFWSFGPVFGFAAAAALGFSAQMIPVWIVLLGGSELLYFLVMRRTARLSCAGAFCFLLGAGVLAILALHFSAYLGTLEPQNFVRFLQERATAFAATMSEMLKSLVSAEQLEGLGSEFDTLLASSLVSALPAMFLSVLFFVAYVASAFLRLLMKKSGALQILYPEGFYPTPSIVTAILYGICLVVSSLFSALLPMELFGALNAVSSLLEVLFAFVGLSVFLRRASERRKGKRSWLFWAALGVFFVVFFTINYQTALYLLIAGGMFCLSLAIPVLSFFGLFHSVFAYVRSRKKPPSDEQKGM